MDISKPISAWTLIFGLLIGDKMSFARFTFGQCLKTSMKLWPNLMGKHSCMLGTLAVVPIVFDN